LTISLAYIASIRATAECFAHFSIYIRLYVRVCACSSLLGTVSKRYKLESQNLERGLTQNL